MVELILVTQSYVYYVYYLIINVIIQLIVYWTAMLHGSEAWCLKESVIGILRRTERSMVRAMYGVQLKDRKRSMNLMLMLGLNETIDQLAMASSVRWYGHVLRREDGLVLRRE